METKKLIGLVVVFFGVVAVIVVAINTSIQNSAVQKRALAAPVHKEPVNTSLKRVNAAREMCEKASVSYFVNEFHIVDGSRNADGTMRTTDASAARLVYSRDAEEFKTSWAMVDVSIKINALVHNHEADYWVDCMVLDENGTDSKPDIQIGTVSCAHDYGDEICFPVL